MFKLYFRILIIDPEKRSSGDCTLPPYVKPTAEKNVNPAVDESDENAQISNSDFSPIDANVPISPGIAENYQTISNSNYYDVLHWK